MKEIAPGIKLQADSFADLKNKVQQQRQESHREAKGCGCKFVRSRGSRMIACDKNGRLNPPHDEPLEWDGSKKQLLKYAISMQKCGAISIVIEGGFDGSEFFNFDDYDPWISEWDFIGVIIESA